MSEDGGAFGSHLRAADFRRVQAHGLHDNRLSIGHQRLHLSFGESARIADLQIGMADRL